MAISPTAVLPSNQLDGGDIQGPSLAPLFLPSTVYNT